MDIKCLTSRKVKIILICFLFFKLDAFSQDDMKAEIDNIEKTQIIEGAYSNYNEKCFTLALKKNDTLIYFKVYEFNLNEESYSTFLLNKDSWNKTNTETILKLDYYVQVYYDSHENKLKHNLVCLDIQVVDCLNGFSRIQMPTYDTNIYSNVGYLKRVELGDYLHITIKDENDKQNTYWVSSEIEEETIDMLYDNLDKDLNLGISIKHCKTVSYIPEAGRPVVQDKCIELYLHE